MERKFVHCLPNHFWNQRNHDQTYNYSIIFYKQRFFSTEPQYFWTFSWIELQMLLSCCLMHITIIYTKTRFIFDTFVSMAWPRSIYVIYMWSILIFSLTFIFINHISLKQRHLFFLHFLECLYYFWMIMWMRKLFLMIFFK